MTTTIITKNSSTASAVPTSSDLVQGELAVNVTDKRLFTENASATIVELGTNPSSITTADITATGTVTANSNLSSSNAVLTGGTVNGIVIGGTTPSAITGTNITANTGFSGPLTGNVTGNLTGNVTGNVTGNLTGNVTASSGTTTLNNLVLNGTVDFNTAVLTDLGAPVASTDAATKGYVDTQVSNLVAAAPAALDTLNELAAAIGDDANFSTTITNSIATKLPLAGGTMTGAIAMGTNKITGLGTPTAGTDAANKTYADTKLSLSGGTMTGNIVLGSNSATSTATPTTDDELTRKGYVDSILGSATSAATSAAAAATSASNAATSESNASTSASNAATSASNAAASYDSFDDRYLGTKTSDPTLDNDGDALVTGALYFNTTSNDMKVYNGSAWQVTALTTTNPTFTGGVTIDDDNNYSFGDGTTYIQGSGAADRLKFITNASEAMRIDSSGNVGIGTSSPNAPLSIEEVNTSVYSTTSISPFSVQVRNDSATTGSIAGIRLVAENSSGSAGSWVIGSLSTSTIYENDLIFQTRSGVSSYAERMRIDSSGNVGIGTTSPASLLHLNSASDPVLRLQRGGGVYSQFQSDSAGSLYLSADAGNTGASSRMQFNVDGSEAARIDSSRNFGIGTSSPSYRLDTQVSSTTWAARVLNTNANGAGLLVRTDSTNNNNALGVYGNGAYRMMVKADGNVGIGTSSPTEKLDVTGTIKATNVQETVYALSGTALDAGNGGIQTKTLAANTTFTDSMTSGEALVLQLEAGASYTVTWPTMTWVSSGGNVAPTLTAKDTIVLWKVSTTLYGAYVGSYV